MSYILDALRRAESERQRGQTPGLYAPATAAAPGPGRRPQAAAGWLVIGLAVGVAASLAWWLMRRDPPPAAAPAAAVAVAPPPAALPAPLPAVATAPVPLPRVVSEPAALRPAPGVAPDTAPVATRPVPWAELAPEQRRELPPLALGGAIWSESAANRFVVFNGQVVREGELAAVGVVLERIEPRAAVLRWRGLAIEVPF
jgi:general secretion pathway protein B